mmetsp:Transcript_3181/g.4256  ORF Transcript_3181/g.4256 Transcript_3181/m.4256 type:complete len:87 (+) Transcript_3181:23-283(+)
MPFLKKKIQVLDCQRCRKSSLPKKRIKFIVDYRFLFPYSSVMIGAVAYPNEAHANAVGPDMHVGKTEASQILSPSNPLTIKRSSTT